jgi:hypothetical protein
MTTGRRLTPVTVDSSTEDSLQAQSDEFDFLDYLEDTLLDDDVQLNDDKPLGESSGTTDKGKGKEVEILPAQPVLELQEELECFICCIFTFEIANFSHVTNRSLYLFTLWSWRLRSLQYSLLLLN